MIYLADDYLNKYNDALSYLLARSYSENYSFDYIQKTISYSHAINELEKSNVTLIAFSSMEKIYNDMFPARENNFVYDEYDIFGWCGYAYMHLFLNRQITFEALFFLIPLEQMMSMYKIYHEMNISRLDDYVDETLKYSLLDIIMKHKKISNSELANSTSLSISTINALRYGKRDINKLEGGKLLLIANALNVKMETLLPTIKLRFFEDY